MAPVKVLAPERHECTQAALREDRGRAGRDIAGDRQSRARTIDVDGALGGAKRQARDADRVARHRARPEGRSRASAIQRPDDRKPAGRQQQGVGGDRAGDGFAGRQLDVDGGGCPGERGGEIGAARQRSEEVVERRDAAGPAVTVAKSKPPDPDMTA